MKNLIITLCGFALIIVLIGLLAMLLGTPPDNMHCESKIAINLATGGPAIVMDCK